MVEEVTPEEVKGQFDHGDDIQVVDIRPERAFAEGHIPGAENIPFDRFAREVENQEWGDDVIVVCPMGESSLQAARLLESYEGVDEDATIANMEGGYQEWDYELESETGARVED
jgi:rhodanese-related sulfurtransferase